MKRVRELPWLIGLVLCGGCGPLSQEQIDQDVALLTARVDKIGANPATTPLAPESASPAPSSVVQTPAVAQDLKPVPMFVPPQKIIVPPELPGATEPPIKLPDDKEARLRYIRGLFPPLPQLPAPQATAPGPEGHPMSLADLQRLAMTYSPAIKNARAAVVAAEGAVKQAGAYPNPNVFFEQDTVETESAGYQGFGFNQVIKTANKLKLQQAAAMMDLLNARLALRRAETDVTYQVRGYYYAVLVALDTNRINVALYRFADEIYRYQVEILEKSGFSTVYQPMQLRPLATSARLAVLQARNQYTASWRQLTAALGLPDMPPSDLEGRVDVPVPEFDFDKVRAYTLENHTDVLSAINSIQKGHYSVMLAKVTPVPDVTINVLVQKDYTSPPFQVAHSLQFGGPLPIWDQNRGAIQQAEGQLRQASAALPQARNALIVTLADAWNRYETAREAVEITLEQVKDQVRVYKGLRARYESDPNNVSFGGDLVTAQQTLAGYIAAYVAALGQQWQAVVDVANLLQNDDLYQTGTPRVMEPIPELEPAPVPRKQEQPKGPPQAAAPSRRQEVAIDGSLWLLPSIRTVAP